MTTNVVHIMEKLDAPDVGGQMQQGSGSLPCIGGLFLLCSYFSGCSPLPSPRANLGQADLYLAEDISVTVSA